MGTNFICFGVMLIRVLNMIGRASGGYRRDAFQKVQFMDYPCRDRSLWRSQTPPKSVHKLRPGDIDVIAAIGDSHTAGNGALTDNLYEAIFKENRGVSWSIGGQGNWTQFLTVPNLLKVMNPDLVGYSIGDGHPYSIPAQFNAAYNGAMDQDLMEQAVWLVNRMKSDPRVDFDNHWKLLSQLRQCTNACNWSQGMQPLHLSRVHIHGSDEPSLALSRSCFGFGCQIGLVGFRMADVPPRLSITLITIMIGTNDICSDQCYSRDEGVEAHRRNLLQLLDFLSDNLPKTFISLVSMPYIPAYADLSHPPFPTCITMQLMACSCLFGGPATHEKLASVVNMTRSFQKVQMEIAESGRYSEREDFAVVFQPTHLNSRFPKRRKRLRSPDPHDYSYIAIDCIHFTQKLHAILANIYWNNLFQDPGSKTSTWDVPAYKEFLCPNKHRPYLVTGKNFRLNYL